MLKKYALALVATVLIGATMGGCPDIELDDFLEDLEININQSVNEIQTIDPRSNDLILVGDAADTVVIIEERADVIVDIRTQLVVEELLDINLIGFENLTGYDIYLIFLVDGVEQGVFVFDGETLLLEYPCIEDLQLLVEEDYDTFTGEFLGDYDLTGLDYFNGDFYADPVDFFCGDAFILTIDPIAITAEADLIDLR